jgi:5-formyltetrahydrofolate cyclo-ligase
MDWAEIRSWRKSQRAALLSRRIAIPQEERRRLRSVIADRVMDVVPQRPGSVIGFYWPFKAEVDLRGLVRALIEAGARAALPVVVEKGRPLEFWEWRPRMPMARGIWNIPIPAERVVVEPMALLVPLVGFDRDHYRLGYGGGYYDRTLAARSPRPYAVGVGYEIGRLATIHPQPHDIPMDAIVTEAGVEAAEDDDCGTFSSPPCFMHELADRGEM